MAQYLYPTDDKQFVQAALMVISSQHGGITTLQRNMGGISFREAEELIRRMRTRGIVGYTTGSKAAPVLARQCEQCGRIGRQGFTKLEATEHTKDMWFCKAKAACRKRWPKNPKDDE